MNPKGEKLLPHLVQLHYELNLLFADLMREDFVWMEKHLLDMEIVIRNARKTVQG